MPIQNDALGVLVSRVAPSFVFAYAILGCTKTESEQLPPKSVKGHLMVHVPAQTTQIGRDGNVPYDEQPKWHQTLEAFYITQTEVTNDEYSRFLNENNMRPDEVIPILGYKGNSTRPTQIVYTGKRFRPALGRERFPVSTVTYNGAEAYCRWLGMRLPTESEWVTAIRAGTKTLYPWGDDASIANASWGQQWKGYMPTAEVGSFQPNAYGIYDGIGNVWEWTSSQYLPYDGRAVSTDYKERYVLRGGDWFVRPGEANVYTRLALEPLVRGLMDGGVGFRCVMGA